MLAAQRATSAPMIPKAYPYRARIYRKGPWASPELTRYYFPWFESAFRLGRNNQGKPGAAQ